MYNLLTSHFLDKKVNSYSPIILTYMPLQFRYLRSIGSCRNTSNREAHGLWLMKRMSLPEGSGIWLYKLCLQAEFGYQTIQITTPVNAKLNSRRKSFPSIWLNIVAGNTFLQKRKKALIFVYSSILFSENRNTVSVKEK